VRGADVETTTVDIDVPGGELKAAMMYLALIAYPESHNKRNRSYKAMFALLNRMARHAKKPMSPSAAELFDEITTKAQGDTLGRGHKGTLPRIFLRLRAANAAELLFASSMLRLTRSGASISIAIENVQHDFVGRALWHGHVSLNDIAKREGSNFKHYVWAVSKPVMHMAFTLRRLRLRDDGRPLYIQLLANPAWIREALPLAESWRANVDHRYPGTHRR